jgi:hypothetical protein
MPEKSDDFYKVMQAFNEFPSVTDLSLYRPLPDDWHIVLADITSSTKAIEEGRYKDVNMMGAACITAVINALPGNSIPYVFGGDGATLAIPSSVRDIVSHTLGATRRLAKTQFGLDLRVGIVPVSVPAQPGELHRHADGGRCPVGGHHDQVSRRTKTISNPGSRE